MPRTLGAVTAALLGAALIFAGPGGTHPQAGAASQTAPEAPALASLIQAYNACGRRLFRAFAREPGNIVLSPYSIGTAMAMVLAGARGENRIEMAKVLGLALPQENIDAANVSALGSLNGLSSASLQLRVADALVLTKQGPAIADTYVAMLRRNYAAEIFRDADVATVNSWVKQRTGGKIPSMLDRLDPAAALVLLNAIYLQAPWQTPFDPGATGNETFQLPTGTVSVPTMYSLRDLALAERPGYRAVRLPYSNSRLAMIVMLPDGRLDDLVKRLDQAELDQLFSRLRAPARLVELWLPRFQARFETSLVRPFTELGMRRAFDPKTADFSGMTAVPPAVSPLAVSQILHRAMVDVGEKGTEAAAATAVELAAGGMPPPHETFRVDRPFLFMIIDAETGAVLFEGRIVDPRQAS